jgi:hypothetical protein
MQIDEAIRKKRERHRSSLEPQFHSNKEPFHRSQISQLMTQRTNRLQQFPFQLNSKRRLFRICGIMTIKEDSKTLFILILEFLVL